MRKLLILIAALFAVETHAAITGRVFDDQGKPLAKATVRAYAVEPSDAVYARLVSDKPEREPDGIATTKEDGSFRVDTKSLLAMLTVEAPGKAFFREAFVDGSDAGGIMLRSFDPIRGRVTSGGKPVENVLVAFGHDVVRRTRADGTYEAPAPYAVTERVSFIHPQYAIVSRPVRSALESANTLDVSLEPGITVRGVVRNAAREPVPNALLSVDGWPMGTSLEDGTFTLTRVPAKWTAITARTADLAGQIVFARGTSHDIVMQRAATLNGTTRNTKDNTPVAGASIVIGGDVEGLPARTFVADAKGAFTATGIFPGDYRVTASHPLFRNDGISLTLTEGASVARQMALTPLGRFTGIVVDEQRKPVAGAVVSAGRTGVVTGPDGRFSVLATPTPMVVPNINVLKDGYVPLQSGPHAIADGETKNLTLTLVRGVPVTVKVVDRQGAPLVNEPVMLMTWRDEPGGRSTVPCVGGQPARCRTDAKGEVPFRVAPGKYDLHAGGDAAPMTQLPAQQLDASTPTITMTVDRGAPIEGRVTYNDGSPLTGDVQWAVTLRAGVNARARVNEDGTFVIKNAPPGPVSIQAISDWLRVEGPVKEVTAPASGVTLTVPKLARIEGKVVDRTSRQPVREFSVNAQTQQQAGGRPRAATQVQADDGAFVLENVPPGIVDVIVTAQGYVAGTVANIELQEGKTVSGVDVQLDRGATVTGRVTSGGAGLADVTITPSFGPTGPPRGGGARSTRSDANGEYTLHGVAAGERAIDFWKEGFVSVRKSVSATAGKESRLDVELTRGRDLRGRVVDGGGNPIAGARVRPQATGFGGMAMRTVLTDVEGNFTLVGLPGDQKLTVIAERDGFLPKTLENVDTNSGAALTITLERGGTLTGRVVGVAETELGMVQVVAGAGRARGTARPDAQGNFTIHGLPDGEVTVYATQHQPRTRRSAQQIVTLTNGTGPSVTLEFGSGVTIRGRVTRAGAPLDAGMLEFRLLNQQGGVNTNAPIGRGGVYEVGIEPGAYRIIVSGPNLARVDGGEVTVSGSMTHDIDLRGSMIRGRVIDAATGTAVIGATVRLEETTPGPRPMVNRTERTDSNGAFAFDLLPDDHYRLRTSAERYASDVQQVVVGSNGSPDLEVRLRPGDRTVLRIIDAAEGRTLEASVIVIDERKETIYSGVPPRDADGAALLWLLPGRYTVRAYAPGYASSSAELTAPGPPMTISMNRAGRIVIQSGRIGLRARILNAQGRSIQQTSLPPGTLENVPAGTYTVEIVDPRDVVLHKQTVTVLPAQTATVVFD